MFKKLMFVVLASMLAATAFAACPDVGTYSTGNGMLPGRVTDSWCTGVPGQPGDLQNSMSWDGSMLGTQWKVWGTVLDQDGYVLVDDQVDPQTGNGYRVFSGNYDGGQFWLSKDGPWGDGVADITGTVTGKTNVVATVNYLNWQPVAAVANVTGTGAIDDCANGCFIDYALSNLQMVWRSDSGLPPPPDYPPFLCGAGDGQMWDACCGSFHVGCAVGDEIDTWSRVKSSYR